MRRLVHRPGYANVVATLALVAALGGTSYAASQLTGKDVKNESLAGKDVKDGSLKGRDVKDGSLTGADLQKQSVPLDRLSGRLPTQLDSEDFVSSRGLYTVSVAPNAWQSINPDLGRIGVFGDWRSATPGGSAALILDPALPTTVAGKPMRLRAVTPCWDDTALNIVISDVIIATFREDTNFNMTDIVELDDVNDQNSKTCKRYTFATPVTLDASTRVNLKLSVGWGALNAMLKVGGVTFELERT
jgi:hypothetical protein